MVEKIISAIEIDKPVALVVTEDEGMALGGLSEAMAAWHSGDMPSATTVHAGLEAVGRITEQTQPVGASTAASDWTASLQRLPDGSAFVSLVGGQHTLALWQDAAGRFCSGTWIDEIAGAAVVLTVKPAGQLQGCVNGAMVDLPGGITPSGWTDEPTTVPLGRKLETLKTLGLSSVFDLVPKASDVLKSHPSPTPSGGRRPIPIPMASAENVPTDPKLPVPKLPQHVPNMAAFCSQCSNPLRPGARFCAKCGTPVGQRVCASCGEPVSPGAKFCKSCGANLK